MANHMCETWQGFIQQAVYLVGRGYHYFHLIDLPERKRDRWPDIDRKLIQKYDSDKSKFQRARQKIKKIANFYFLRWNHCAVIMHTYGTTDHVTYDDSFSDIRVRPLTVYVSDNVELVLYVDGGTCSVRMASMTYKGFKASLADTAKLRQPQMLIWEYNKINGIPAYAGIVEQKRRLADWTVKQAARNQVKISRKDLSINTRRKIYKVWT